MFTTGDLERLRALVATAWGSALDRDWSVRAGTLEWTCAATADHGIDTVLAPAIFLASRRRDAYPDLWPPFTLGPQPSAERLIEGLETATRVLVAVIAAADPDERAVVWRRPTVQTATPGDFAPPAGLELILHAHDVCQGLAVAFEPPPDLCERLRDHTRGWPMWHGAWSAPGTTQDPWDDLLRASKRR